MSAPRFYCPPPLPISTNFELPAAAAHHASRVLRLRVNDAIQIFDGIGNALDATINSINGKRVILGNLQTCMAQANVGLHIVLAQAMCSSDKMDLIVQKPQNWALPKFCPCKRNVVLRNFPGHVPKNAPSIGVVSLFRPVNNAGATICRKFMPRKNWTLGCCRCVTLPVVNLFCYRAEPLNCEASPRRKAVPRY